jgi:hypothetical protein
MWLIVELDEATPRAELDLIVAQLRAHRPWVREAVLAEQIDQQAADGSPG